MAKIQLSASDILEKDFKKSMNGYNKDEVDVFLDMIIKDYEAFSYEMERLKTENIRLLKQLEEVKLAAPAPSSPMKAAANSSVDILKRISNLEKAVFGDKL